MLNLQICEVLLAGLAETTHIVLVGDADQLPPVGAGKPFGDLIAADIAPITRLTHVFRQAARSMIITAAHAVNEGRDPDLEPGPDQERDFFFMDRPNPAHAVEAVPRSSPSGSPTASAWTLCATSRCWRRCTRRRSASTR